MLLGCLVMFVGVFVLGKFTNLSWGWLLLLACPLAHVFMMKGMQHSESKKSEPDNLVQSRTRSPHSK